MTESALQDSASTDPGAEARNLLRELYTCGGWLSLSGKTYTPGRLTIRGDVSGGDTATSEDITERTFYFLTEDTDSPPATHALAVAKLRLACTEFAEVDAQQMLSNEELSGLAACRE